MIRSQEGSRIWVRPSGFLMRIGAWETGSACSVRAWGGYVSLIRASMEKGIRALVVWATPFHLDDLGTKRYEEDYALPGEAFFRDVPKHRLGPLLPKVSNCLVIHGEADELVPVDQAWEIFHPLGGGKEIHILEHADHRLSDPSHRQRAIDLSIQWFKKFL